MLALLTATVSRLLTAADVPFQVASGKERLTGAESTVEETLRWAHQLPLIGGLALI